MTDIHPLPPREERVSLNISPVKGVIFAIIVLGVFVFGFFAQYMPKPNISKDTAQVLGEDIIISESTESASLSGILKLGGKESDIKPEALYLTGKEFLASTTSELASKAAVQTEKVASEAAKNITEFVYKNTIERIINSLIRSLPEERQKQYSQ